MKSTTAILILFILLVAGCKREYSPIHQDPAFTAYISAFTTGVIGSKSSIRIRLASPVNQADSMEADQSLLEFKPAIAGKLSWSDAQTLEFRPDNPLPTGATYTGTLHLDKLYEVNDELRAFEFNFQVADQHVQCSAHTLKPYSAEEMTWHYLEGTLRTSDHCDSQALEECVSVVIGGKSFPVKWSHNEGALAHTFTADSIARTHTAQVIEVKWNGASIASDDFGRQEVRLPALGDFEITETRTEQSPEQRVVIRFSDPLNPGQDLAGLVRLSNGTTLTTAVEINELIVYPQQKVSGQLDLEIDESVENRLGFRLGTTQTIPVVFEQIKPNVRLLNASGTILPSSNGLRFPFEAVNLSAVDVRIIQLFENNIPQFLQVNDLAGKREMKRAGRLVKNIKLPLNPKGNRDLSVWQDFYIDLEELIAPNPGAIYRIELAFRQEYSLWECGNAPVAEEMESTDNWDEDSNVDQSYWDFADSYYYDYDYGYWGSYYYGSGYSYRERENPCHVSYYMAQEPVGRNILASDLGVIVKGSADDHFTVVVSNLLTTLPVSGAKVELLNYQQQHLANATTDKNGMTTFSNLENRPFLLVAKHGKSTSYVKLDRNSALAVSKFDVGGAGMSKGMKGFIYGERGVWRPGDDLFLTFMLENQGEPLPAEHPIKYELINAKGQVVDRQVVPNKSSGVFCFTSHTDPEAPTGNWTARIRVGGSVFNKYVKVETIKPNRLKINLDFNKEYVTSADNSTNGTMKVKWLHGAPARNLKARVTARLRQIKTQFKTHTDYQFDDVVRRFDGEEIVIFEDRLNNDGEAHLEMQMGTERMAPGKLKAYLETKVYEEGGEFSIDHHSIEFSPYLSYVGIKLPKGDRARNMLLTDVDHQMDIVTFDQDGNPVKRDSLLVSIYEVGWRWWWDRNEDDLDRFETGEGVVPYFMGKASTDKKGNGQFAFRVNYPEWGRFLIRVEDPVSGHVTSQTFYIDWPGWAGRAQKENPGGESMLVFNSDKDGYEVGETCTITFPSSESGRALATIEDGNGVLRAEWIQTQKGQTSWTFPITKEMAPNVYASITLVQPHNQTLNDLPIRLYGTIPIIVEDPSTHLSPVIHTVESFKPEEEYVIEVSESSGRGMSYTLAIVDEGLLDLTGFDTPDPWKHFYAREALGVTTWDVYDDVIGAFLAEQGKLLTIGGGGELEKKGKNKANRFKPVVEFAGPFTLQPGKKAKHTFVMPNYVGSVRVMVVAREDKSYGNAEKAVPVKKALMTLATAPRVIGPDEEFTLPVTVFAMEDRIKNATVKVSSNALLEVKGSSSRTIQFNGQTDQMVNFKLKALPRMGVATIHVEVTSGKEKAHYDVEMDVRNPNPPQTVVHKHYLEAGQSWDKSFDLTGMAGTNQLTVEVSSIPPIDLSRRMHYLLSYPHGCVEQTTSKAFPQLFLEDISELNEYQRIVMETNVKEAINRLASFQMAHGGFSYWPGRSNASDWGSTYAGHFLLMARTKGYTVPAHMINSWLSHQKEMATSWRPLDSGERNYSSHYLAQAYRLYSLAYAGEAQLSQMNRLRQIENLDQVASYVLAGAYAMAGKRSIAESMIQDLSLQVQPYNELSYSYGSDTRDLGMIAMSLMWIEKREKAAEVVTMLSERLSAEHWYSTQTTAFAMMGVASFAREIKDRNMNVTYTFNDESPVTVATTHAFVQRQLTEDRLNGNQLALTNEGKSGVYVRLINQGTPMIGNLTPVSNDLVLEVKYLDLNDHTIDITSLAQGTDFKAVVTVKHPGLARDYREMALTQIIPSGWEIHNVRMDQATSVHQSSIPDYEDIRDDRSYKYFSMPRNGNVSFVLLLHATYQGRYFLPAVHCEAMYDHTVNAQSAGRWVEVVASEGSYASASGQ